MLQSRWVFFQTEIDKQQKGRECQFKDEKGSTILVPIIKIIIIITTTATDQQYTLASPSRIERNKGLYTHRPPVIKPQYKLFVTNSLSYWPLTFLQRDTRVPDIVRH